MDFFALIRSRSGGQAITFDKWCDFVRRRSDFVRAEPVQGKNPLTGEPITIYPRPDGASVIKDGRTIVHLGWSQSGIDEIILSGDRHEVIFLARQIAAVLSGECVELLPDDSTRPL